MDTLPEDAGDRGAHPALRPWTALAKPSDLP